MGVWEYGSMEYGFWEDACVSLVQLSLSFGKVKLLNRCTCISCIGFFAVEISVGAISATGNAGVRSVVYQFRRLTLQTSCIAA